MSSTTSPYSDAELKQALGSLLQAESTDPLDASHIFAHGDPNHSLSMLQTITATRILDYSSNKQSVPIDTLLQQGQSMAEKHGAILNLQTVIQQQSPRMALAAEFKRASPSKGAIAIHLNAGEQAQVYTHAGADIISVLTEDRWFLGSLQDLTQVRLQTSTSKHRPAVLRKDFVVNKYMIAEAAAAGADTVLLIVAVLPRLLLKQLIQYSRSLGMEPLVEVHADQELDVALQAGAKVIGVNNRNLHTFQLDLATSERVAHQLQERGLSFHHTDANAQYTLCALSGMSTACDVDRYRRVGLGMCLIGESLMRATDPKAAIQSLCLHPDDYAKASSSQELGGGAAYTAGTQIVKVCGITNPDDARVACQAGANMIGIIFAEKSKRKVSKEQARVVAQAVQAFGERSAPLAWRALPTQSAALPSLVASSRMLVEQTRRPVVVGVFQNQNRAFIQEMVRDCGLDLVQLHGSEGMDAANRNLYGVPVIRVVDISIDPITGAAASDAVDNILASITKDPVAILLDTSIKGQKDGGGTGAAFDWNIARRVQDGGLPVIIAGGLTADSICECVSTARPFGVDVSSGVEFSPGMKDHEKVKAFVQEARNAAREASKGF